MHNQLTNSRYIMACVATWSFGLQAVQIASAELERSVGCVEALEKGINAVEEDPSTGKFYVGRGCYPNSGGVVELDAGLMRGRDRSYGAVAGLKGCARPLSVARQVMEHPKLNFVVGEGAGKFAKQAGFVMEGNDSLTSAETKQAYQEYREKGQVPPPTGHDTLSLLCLDKAGELAVGVSTSGPAFKPPGRVGDSPLPGCGLYADDKAGAAAATGDGEVIMKFCASFNVVLLMGEGRSPTQACEEVVKKMKNECDGVIEVALIALDSQGNAGAASTVQEWKDFRDGSVYSGFPYAVWRSGDQSRIQVQSPV